MNKQECAEVLQLLTDMPWERPAKLDADTTRWWLARLTEFGAGWQDGHHW